MEKKFISTISVTKKMEINCLCFCKHCIRSTVYLDPCMEKTFISTISVTKKMEINCLCFCKHGIGSTVYLDPCMEKKFISTISVTKKMEINCLCFCKHGIGSTVYLDPCMEKKVHFHYFSHKKDGDKLSLLLPALHRVHGILRSVHGEKSLFPLFQSQKRWMEISCLCFIRTAAGMVLFHILNTLIFSVKTRLEGKFCSACHD